MFYNYRIIRARIFVSLIFLLLLATTYGQSRNKDSLKISQELDSAMYYSRRDNAKFQYFLDQIEKMLDTSDYPSLRSKFYTNKGIYYRSVGNLPKSLEYRLKSLDINRKLNDSMGIAINYHNIGATLTSQKKYFEAEEYLKKSIEVKEKLKDPRELALSYNFLGIIYRRQTKYDKSEEYYKKALDISTPLGYVDVINTAKGNLSTLYIAQGKYLESIEINKSLLSYHMSEGQLPSLATKYYNIAVSYQRLKDYNSALVYINNAINIAEKENLKLKLINYYVRKSTILRKLGKYKESLSYHRKGTKIKDSVYNIRNANKIKKLLEDEEIKRIKIRDSIKNAESKGRLILELETRKKSNYILILSILVLLILSVSYYSKSRGKRKLLKSQLDKARLQKVILDEKIKANKREKEQVLINNKTQIKYRNKIINHIKSIREEKNTQSVFKDLRILQIDLENQNRKINKNSLLSTTKKDDINPLDFENKLNEKFPTLTKGERELCIYIMANMSIKEIANIKNVSNTSVQSMRYRIRKKMNLKPGEELKKSLQTL